MHNTCFEKNIYQLLAQKIVGSENRGRSINQKVCEIAESSTMEEKAEELINRLIHDVNNLREERNSNNNRQTTA